jgi:hypothetical protein
MSSRRSDVSGVSIAWGRPTGPPCPHTADCHERDDHPLSQTFGHPAGPAGDVVPAGTASTQPGRPSLTSSSLHCRSSRRCDTAMNCASRRQLGGRCGQTIAASAARRRRAGSEVVAGRGTGGLCPRMTTDSHAHSAGVAGYRPDRGRQRGAQDAQPTATRCTGFPPVSLRALLVASAGAPPD